MCEKLMFVWNASSRTGCDVESRSIAKLPGTLCSFAAVRHELSRLQTFPNVLFPFNFVAA